VLASTAQVALPETRLGIIPGAGGTYRLPALIGISRARDLILTGRRVSAAEAYFLGIADRLVEVVPEEGETNEALMKRAGDGVLRESIKLAGDICVGAPIAVRSALFAVNGRMASIEDRAAVENAMYDSVVKTADRNEALKAFGEKRKPIFTGR
jgi:methylglutaconyl-CoA hydratase